MSDDSPSFVFTKENGSPSPAAILDIVFVHGLSGDRFTTWTASGPDTFWPRWLAEEFPNVNVYTAGYDSTVFAKVFVGGGPTLIDRATMLLDGLLSRPTKASAILFIAHSLGGLIVKQMLRKCHDSANDDHKDFLASVRGVWFIGTPHQGAQAANSIRAVLGIFLSKTVHQLAYGEEPLGDLNEWFRNWAGISKIHVRAYYETEAVKGIIVVDKLSANPNVLGCEPIALPSDHIEMCKPLTREAQLYQSMRETVRLGLVDIQASMACDDSSSTSNGIYAGALSANADHLGLEPNILSDYETFTTAAPDDRRSLAEKLVAGGRAYQVRAAEQKKEAFSMLLQRHIAQPSALTQYTQIMAAVEARFNRHAARVIASGGSLEAIDEIVQSEVIDPVFESHGTGLAVSASTIDGALYYLTGNCHLRWDHDED